MPLTPGRVAGGDQFLEKSQVFVATGEVPATTHVQSLVHGSLEVPMGRLGVAILVRLADVDPLAREVVMFQEPPIAGLELAFGRKVVDRRGQAVAAMPSRHSPQFPQRVLQAVGQGLEGLRRAEGHRLPVGVGQHEVIRQVLEASAKDGDSQGIHAGEI